MKITIEVTPQELNELIKKEPCRNEALTEKDKPVYVLKKYSIGKCHKCGHKEIIPYDKDNKYCTMCGGTIEYLNVQTIWNGEKLVVKF